MNNNILTLEQMQIMSIEEIVDAYRNGYILSERSETLPQTSQTLTNTNTSQTLTNTNTPQRLTTPQTLTNTPQIYSASNGSHYTTSDIGVIAAAIGISVGLLGLLTWYIIKKEEDRIVSQIKDAVKSATSKVGLIERLIPLAERIGERILPPKA